LGVLKNSIDIARPPVEVFEYCSDQCNELEWTPGPMKSCEKLTDGPVGLGTRYRAAWSGAGSRIVEITRYDHPRSWQASADSGAIGMVFDASVEAIPGGSRLVVQTDVRAHGLARLASPLLDRVMQRQRVQSLAAIKRTLEAKPAAADSID
jgi:hypothetical protein